MKKIIWTLLFKIQNTNKKTTTQGSTGIVPFYNI